MIALLIMTSIVNAPCVTSLFNHLQSPENHYNMPIYGVLANIPNDMVTL